MKGLFLCILITIIGISTVWASDGNLKISDNSSTSQEIVMASGQQVLPNNGPYMGHGYILGSPINLGDTGLFFPTYEVQINQGRFTDDKTYIGSTVQLSIDDRNQDILNKFKEIEERNHELFVFEYYHKSSWNFEIENTQLFLINIYTLAEFIEHMQAENIPKGIKSLNPWQGSNGTKKKIGRIVDIEREGLIGDFCEIEVNLGGLGTSGGSGTQEALVLLSIVDEDICKWAEKAIAYGRDVDIEVAQDVFEVWQPSSSFVTAIRFKDNPNINNSDTNNSMNLSNLKLNNAQYLEIKERLLKDPEFLKALMDSVNTYEVQDLE